MEEETPDIWRELFINKDIFFPSYIYYRNESIRELQEKIITKKGRYIQ